MVAQWSLQGEWVGDTEVFAGVWRAAEEGSVPLSTAGTAISSIACEAAALCLLASLLMGKLSKQLWKSKAP